MFTYIALGCRRILPLSPTAISYFTNSRNYVKTEITNNVVRRLTGDGLVVTAGDEHRRQRKVLNPAFSSEHIKRLVTPFWTKACELTTVLEQEGVQPGEGEGKGGYNIVQVLTRTTLDIIGLAGITFPKYFFG